MSYKKYKFSFLLISLFTFFISFFITLVSAQSNVSKNLAPANSSPSKSNSTTKTRPVPKAEKQEEDIALTATVILSKRQMCLDFMNSFTKTTNYQFAWQDNKLPEIGLFSNIQNNINGCGQIRLPIDKGKKTPNQAFITVVTNNKSSRQPGMLELLAKQFTKTVIAGKAAEQIDYASFSKACMLYTENIIKNKQLIDKSIVSFGVYLPVFPLDIKTDAPQLKAYAANLNKALKVAIEKGCDGKGRKSDDSKGTRGSSSGGSGGGSRAGCGAGSGAKNDGYGGLSKFVGLGNDDSELDIDDGTDCTTTAGTTTKGTTTAGTTTAGTTTKGTTTAGTTTAGTTTAGTTTAGTTTAGTTTEDTTTAGTTIAGTTVAGTTVSGTSTSYTTISGTTISGTTTSGTTTSGTTTSGTTTSSTTTSGTTTGSTTTSGTTTGSTTTGGIIPADCTKTPIPQSCCTDVPLPDSRVNACCNRIPALSPIPQGCVSAGPDPTPGDICPPNLVGNCIPSVYDGDAVSNQTNIVFFSPQSGFIYNLPNPGGESFQKTINGKVLNMPIPCYSANACSDIYFYWQNYSQNRQYLLNQSLDNYYNTADQLWIFPATAWKNKYRLEYDRDINSDPKIIPLGPMDN